MIRTLIVDDDYRVARAHATSVDRIDGFTSVGEAHSGAEASALIQSLQPDLLLLDLYLPDQNGLVLMRAIGELAPGHRPDFIVITAARDIDSVREAMQLGAVYYLVKPFGFNQLSEQLTAYRRLRAGLAEAGVANQDTVDNLYALLRGPGSRVAERRRLPATMDRIFQLIRTSPEPVSAIDVAEKLGFSRATAQRYLADLVRRDLIELSLNYGSTGRPEHRYQLRYRT